MDVFSFEQGPIRPPSEAKSLLLRITRNCPWNKCGFCRTYQGTRFSLRSVDEVKQDIITIKRIHDEIKVLAWRMGFKGEVTEEVFSHLYHDQRAQSSSFMNVALWLFYGERSVFLQDANNLAAKTSDLVEMLRFLKEAFPDISRITTYARSRTIAKRKTREELESLHEAGLTRIHIGLESGSDEVLTLIRKGVTAAEHIEAGRKVKEAGISLSEYVIPGLGGRDLWQKHALETARVLNQINPDYIRLRTLRIVDKTGLAAKMALGEFAPLGDEEIVREIHLMIEHLDGITSYLISDHILNLLEELEGKFPEDKTKLLTTTDRFLKLPTSEQSNFRLGRRANVYHALDDMKNPELYHQVDRALKQVLQSNEQGFEEIIAELTREYI